MDTYLPFIARNHVDGQHMGALTGSLLPCPCQSQSQKYSSIQGGPCENAPLI
jgi:hypothetical protein